MAVYTKIDNRDLLSLSNSYKLGKITKLNDQFAILEVNANSQIKIQKQTVQAVLPKGTIKSI